MHSGRLRLVAHAACAYLAAAGLAACARESATAPPPTPSAEATAHLNQILGLMEANSIRRLTIDWKAFRDTVFAAARDARSVPETFPAILVALTMLHDGHSSYRPAGGGSIFVPTRTCVPSGAAAPAVPGGIGYVRVGSFGGSGAAATAFADAIRATIRGQDRQDLIGWIVDLRGNGGGNMWPMIAGLGPILGEGLLGHFVDPTGVVEAWGYEGGAAVLTGVEVQRASSTYRLLRENPRVAVLADNGIASSGEATFIAFIGRPDTRSFGTSTCGLSTANRGFPLNNGATLVLTTSVMADRTMRQYGDSVRPDYMATSQPDAVARAIAWLQAAAATTAATVRGTGSPRREE